MKNSKFKMEKLAILLVILLGTDYSGQTEPLNPGQTEPVIPGQTEPLIPVKLSHLRV